MVKIIQFPKKEEDADTEKEIWEVIEESYRVKNEEIRKQHEEEWRLYEEFYEDEEWVEAFYHLPYV